MYTDYYLNNKNAEDRLIEEWQKYGKIIIAYDYDDTVFDFHKKGRTYDNIISLLKECKKIGAYFIVFTSCGEDKYDDIKKDLINRNIPFDTINENLPFIKFLGRKVYYNILLCDRAGLLSAYETLKIALNYIKIDKNYKNHCV